MKKGTFEKLKKSFEEAVAIESGELAPARVSPTRSFPRARRRKISSMPALVRSHRPEISPPRRFE